MTWWRVSQVLQAWPGYTSRGHGMWRGSRDPGRGFALGSSYWSSGRQAGCLAPLWGIPSPTVCVLAGAPGPPGVPIIVRYSSAIAIHWSSGDPGKGPITRYVLEARPSGTSAQAEPAGGHRVTRRLCSAGGSKGGPCGRWDTGLAP